MAIKRVVLHLGMAKAGSSSIQHTLFHNTAILKKNGFRYLNEWEESHLRKLHYLLSSHPVNPISTGHLGKPPADKKRQNKISIETMLKVMNTTECETLIISGEYFHDLWLDSTIENISHFIDKYFKNRGINVTIIYIIRNPLTWMISYLQQTLYRVGFMNKHCDYFEVAMKKYRGIINLQKHFFDSLTLLKFEDACLDKDGLVGSYLKTIGFPEDELKNIHIHRTNESRCMEVMEFLYYVESIEPRYPHAHYRYINRNSYFDDFSCIKDIKGVKFDLPYESKVELWGRFQESVCLVKENTGIDYTDYIVPFPSSPSHEQKTYSEETIKGFIEAFPKLNFILQKHFLTFFEKKHVETAQEKFKQLYFKNSVPHTLYNSKSVFFNLLSLRIKNKIRKIKKIAGERIPLKIKRIYKKNFNSFFQK